MFKLIASIFSRSRPQPTPQPHDPPPTHRTPPPPRPKAKGGVEGPATLTKQLEVTDFPLLSIIVLKIPTPCNYSC